MKVSKKLISNLLVLFGLAVVYNGWLFLFESEPLPYIVVTLLNGVVAYQLFQGTPLQKRFMVALGPFTMYLSPVLSQNSEYDPYVLVMLQVCIVGMFVVQLWEVILWVVKGVNPFPKFSKPFSTHNNQIKKETS